MMNRLLPLYTIAFLFSFATACNNKDKQQQQQNKILPYKYIETAAQVAIINNDYPATLQGVQDIDIRPMVDGYIQAVYVDEGQSVSKGQPLFKITNPQYEQTLRSAEAALASTKTQVDNARMQVTKVRPLVEKDIISAYELQAAELQLKSAQAAYAQSQAAVANARTNVGYTNVSAPVSGVVGTLPYRIGSYVNSATAQPLTTISSIGNVYAYFSVNEKDQLQFFKNTQGASIQEKIKSIPAVQLITSDGTLYAEKGKVQSISGQVNEQTGSFNLRATFANPSGYLRSGSSAKVRIPTTFYDAIVIPQAATFEIQGQHFVYIINNDSVVRQSLIVVTDMLDGKKYIVNEGLKAGQKVVVEGVGILKDSTRISPQKTTLEMVTNREAAR